MKLNEIEFQVTAVTNYKRPEPHVNYTEILILPPYDDRADCNASIIINQKFHVIHQQIQFFNFSSTFRFLFDEIRQCLGKPVFDVGCWTEEH